MSDFTFKIVGTAVMLTIAAALGVWAKRQTAREPLTRFAIARACLIGFAAAYACWIAARISQHLAAVFLVPLVLAVVLVWCARLFERVGARALAVLCGVPGALCVGLLALLMWFAAEDARDGTFGNKSGPRSE